MGEDREQLVEVRRDDAWYAAEQMEECAEHGPVLEEVVLQRQDPDDHRQDLVQRDCIAVLEDHTRDGASCVVARVELRGGRIGRDLEEWAECGEQVQVLRGEIDCAVFDEDADGEGGVAVHLGLIVRKGLVEELEERQR